jgi:Glycosyltransferase family 87
VETAAAAPESPPSAAVPRRRPDGRLVVLAALLAYLAVLAYPHYTSYAPNWTRMGILDEPVTFADLRSITSAWECVRKGEQVIVRNDCDPDRQRPANYPNLWIRLSFLGLGQSVTTAFGIGLGVLFVGSIFLLAGRLTLLEGLLWSAFVTSPSIMLGVNRGNVDLLLFALLVLALAALGRAGTRVRVLGCALVELAAVLKLFPVFASAAVLHWRRRPALLAFAALTLVFAAYALVIRHEIETIRSVVPTYVNLSFGAGVLVDALRQRYGDTAFLVGDRPLAVAAVGLGTLALAAALAIALGRWRREKPDASTRLPWLWAGGAVFLGTWAVTENSFDYRLAFCLLAVPQLLEWARQRRPAMPLARSALVTLAVALWVSDTQPQLWSAIDEPWLRAESHFPFDELLVWGLVVYFAVALLRTLPPWLRPGGEEAPSNVGLGG